MADSAEKGTSARPWSEYGASDTDFAPAAFPPPYEGVMGRGLHSSTFQLNLSRSDMDTAYIFAVIS